MPSRSRRVPDSSGRCWSASPSGRRSRTARARRSSACTTLLVSGGHTLLIDVEAWGSYRMLGATRDDAAGEAFDKVAKLLGLPYPGGRHIERLAGEASADEARPFRFTRPMLRGDQQLGDPDYFDVSFSGLKTAVLHAVRGSENLERD